MVLLIQTSFIYNVNLVENQNLELAESILSFIKNFDNVKHDNHIQFNESYKTALCLLN